MVFHGPTSSADGSQAEGAYMSDVHVYNSKRYPNHTPGIHGIFVDCRVYFERVAVTDFGGDGIRIEAPLPLRNANSWSLKDIFVEDNEDGASIRGGNTNGGVVINVLTLSNRRYGIYNSSYLGSTFVGCLAEANVKSFRSDQQENIPGGGVNQSTWIGCYAESGQAPEEDDHPAVIVGGVHGAGFSRDSTALRILNFGNVSPMVIRNDLGVDTLETYLGLAGAHDAILGWRAKREKEAFILDYGKFYGGYYTLRNEASPSPTFFFPVPLHRTALEKFGFVMVFSLVVI